MAFKQGGWFMFLILTFALLGIAIVIERMIVIMIKNRVDSVGFVNQIVDDINSNNINDAINLCNHSKAALPQIVRAGLESTDQGLEEVQVYVEDTDGDGMMNWGGSSQEIWWALAESVNKAKPKDILDVESKTTRGRDALNSLLLWLLDQFPILQELLGL